MSGVTSPIGLRVKALREKRGLTKEQLQDAAELAAGYLTRLENKGLPKNLPEERAEALAKALGVTVSDITGVVKMVSDVDDPYPSRVQAVAILEEDERISAGTLKALRRTQRADGKDPGLKAWLHMAAEIERDSQDAKRERDAMFNVRPGKRP